MITARGDLGQKVVDRGEMVSGSGMGHRRPARALAQGKAAQTLFLQELAPRRDQRFAQLAVVIGLRRFCPRHGGYPLMQRWCCQEIKP